jgi:hypothetical protein
MESWEVLGNDHAREILSGEVDRLVGLVEAVLAGGSDHTSLAIRRMFRGRPHTR